jgi:hypothetical protein
MVADRVCLVLGVISLHFMKRFFYHENTKAGKHENYFILISCFSRCGEMLS